MKKIKFRIIAIHCYYYAGLITVDELVDQMDMLQDICILKNYKFSYAASFTTKNLTK